MRYLIAPLICVCLTPATGCAQDVTVSRSNKTVEVTVTATIDADPEVAVLSLGHTAYGRTHDAAFADNMRAADRIIQVLLDAHVPRAAIETNQLRLERTEPNDKWTPEQRAERQFTASQSWDVRVPVASAQSVLDAAVREGANDLSDVSWQVKDQEALDAKASQAALNKARGLAQQMVAGLGGKLGELLYASNTVRRPKGWPFPATLNTEMASVGRRQPELKLFPQKVEQEATVHAIFAIDGERDDVDGRPGTEKKAQEPGAASSCCLPGAGRDLSGRGAGESAGRRQG